MEQIYLEYFGFFYPPNKPEYLPAIVLHDYLCEIEKFEEVGTILKSCLTDLEVNGRTIDLFYKTTTIFLFIKHDILK